MFNVTHLILSRLRLSCTTRDRRQIDFTSSHSIHLVSSDWLPSENGLQCDETTNSTHIPKCKITGDVRVKCDISVSFLCRCLSTVLVLTASAPTRTSKHRR